MCICFCLRVQDDTRHDWIFSFNRMRFNMWHKCFMCHLEANDFIMMISFGVFQERNTILTHNVEYDLWEAYIYVLVCNQHTILSFGFKWLHMSWISIRCQKCCQLRLQWTPWNRSNILALNGEMKFIQCQDDNRVCIWFNDAIIMLHFISSCGRFSSESKQPE